MDILHGLYINESAGKGRGVFTRIDIQKDKIVEISPVIVIPEEEVDNLLKTPFRNYDYEWEAGAAAIVMGYGSMYNHSKNPNVEFERLVGDNAMKYVSIKDIKAGEELLIDYTQGYPDMNNLWFSVVEKQDSTIQ